MALGTRTNTSRRKKGIPPILFSGAMQVHSAMEKVLPTRVVTGCHASCDGLAKFPQEGPPMPSLPQLTSCQPSPRRRLQPARGSSNRWHQPDATAPGQTYRTQAVLFHNAGIRVGKWKYLKPDAFFHGYAVEDGRKKVAELFDLENDLEETTNLAQRNPEKVQNSSQVEAVEGQDRLRPEDGKR